MPQHFLQHLQKFISISDVEFDGVMAYFKQVKVRKKENLLSEGQICHANYFVQKGCLRRFFINEKGVEQTTEFAIENWWITDIAAFEQQKTTQSFIQSVEPSELLVLEYQLQEKLLKEFPQMERYFRFIYQRAYSAAQIRIKYLYDFSREELYFHFLDQHPDFVQRVPQYLLASFLGFTPEYLSEIRAKKRS